MDWTAAIDGYCERLGPGFWAEPLNAATNAAFLIAAVAAWRMSAGVPVARALAAILGGIATGSFLFHSFATRWAAVADVLPIAAFILTYVWAANRHLLRLSPPGAAVATAAYLPVHAALSVPLSSLPVLGASAGYLPVPVAILGYAAALCRRARETALGMAIGAAVLFLSVLLRSLDAALCPSWPSGTHFLWHLLNGFVLWWMIRVLVRHERRDLRAASAS